MNWKTWAALAGMAALAACASGGRGGGGDDPIRALLSADALMFVGFDADGDLATSSAEIEAGIAREFARADTSQDGALQPIEFQNWSALALGGSQMGPYRLDFDRDVSDAITRAEFENEVRARARDYDSDEDGALRRSEFVRLVGQARPPPVRREPAAPSLGPSR